MQSQRSIQMQHIYKISKKSAKAAKLDSVLGGGSLWFCETVCCVYAFHTAICISLYIPKIKHFIFIGKLIWPAVALLAEQGVESWMTCTQCMCSMYCYLRNAMASSPCHRLLFHCGNLAYLGVFEEERGKPYLCTILYKLICSRFNVHTFPRISMFLWFGKKKVWIKARYPWTCLLNRLPALQVQMVPLIGIIPPYDSSGLWQICTRIICLTISTQGHVCIQSCRSWARFFEAKLPLNIWHGGEHGQLSPLVMATCIVEPPEFHHSDLHHPPNCWKICAAWSPNSVP